MNAFDIYLYQHDPVYRQWWRQKAIDRIRVQIEYFQAENDSLLVERNQYCGEIVSLIENGLAKQSDITAYNRIIEQLDAERAKNAEKIKELESRIYAGV